MHNISLSKSCGLKTDKTSLSRAFIPLVLKSYFTQWVHSNNIAIETNAPRKTCVTREVMSKVSKQRIQRSKNISFSDYPRKLIPNKNKYNNNTCIFERTVQR